MPALTRSRWRQPDGSGIPTANQTTPHYAETLATIDTKNAGNFGTTFWQYLDSLKAEIHATHLPMLRALDVLAWMWIDTAQ